MRNKWSLSACHPARCYDCQSYRGRVSQDGSVRNEKGGGHLLKYSLILSFETLSGRLPTHRCLVSRTITNHRCGLESLSHRLTIHMETSPIRCLRHPPPLRSLPVTDVRSQGAPRGRRYERPAAPASCCCHAARAGYTLTISLRVNQHF